MPNIASVLKSEIARICRKDLRAEIGGLRKSSANYRREIAALKREVAGLGKAIPRAAQLSALAKVRSMGKREAEAALSLTK